MNYGGAPDQYAMMRPGQPGAAPPQHMGQRMMMAPGAATGHQMGAGAMQRGGPAMYPGMGPAGMQPMGPQGPMGQGYAMTPQQQMIFQQRQQQHQMQQIIAHFPPEAQERINNEPDPQKRGMLFQQNYQQLKMRQQQQMVQGGGARMAGPGGTQGIMRPMPPGYPQGTNPAMVGAQQPGTHGAAGGVMHSMQRVPSSSALVGSMGAAPGMPVTSSGMMPSGMGPANVSMPPSVNGPPAGMPPGSSAPGGTMPRPAIPAMTSGHSGPGSASQAPVPSPQVTSLQTGQSGMAGTSPAAALHAQSPASAAQPNTPATGPASINPPSSGPASQQTIMSEEEREAYKKKIKELSDSFREPLQRIWDRAKLEGAPAPAGLEKFFDVVDEKMMVRYDFLCRLEKSISRLIDCNCPTFPLMEALRKCSERAESLQASATAGTTTVATPLVSVTDCGASPSSLMADDKQSPLAEVIARGPWGRLRHLAIKVPAHVRAQYARPKRRIEMISEDVQAEFNEEGELVDLTIPKKMIKLEDGMAASTSRCGTPVFRRSGSAMDNKKMMKGDEGPNSVEMSTDIEPSRFSQMATKSSTMHHDSPLAATVKNEQQSAEGSPPAESTISVSCLFDARLEWSMSAQACSELTAADVRWRVDAAHHPPGADTPDIQLCIESDTLMCCPLRVLVPLAYPSQPPQILFERSFPVTAPLSASLEQLFRRRLLHHQEKLLPAIIHAWRAACDQQLHMSTSSHPTPPPLGSAPFPAPAKQMVA